LRKSFLTSPLCAETGKANVKNINNKVKNPARRKTLRGFLNNPE